MFSTSSCIDLWHRLQCYIHYFGILTLADKLFVTLLMTLNLISKATYLAIYWCCPSKIISCCIYNVRKTFHICLFKKDLSYEFISTLTFDCKVRFLKATISFTNSSNNDFQLGKISYMLLICVEVLYFHICLSILKHLPH